MAYGSQTIQITDIIFTMKNPQISIIIPNYNEESNLKRGVLEDVNKYLSKQKYSWEVIISDDGSTDSSPDIIKKFAAKHKNFKFIDNKHAGKPYALRSGIKHAKGKYVLFTDMDQSTPIQEIAKLLPHTEDGFKVVIGSRGSIREDAPLYRKLASVIFQSVRRFILLPRVVDTQCGFKLLDCKLADQIFSQMRIFKRDNNAKGWKVTAYDVEMLHLSKRLGYFIKEVKVKWKDEDVSEGKARNFVKESYEMMFEVLRVRINDLLGKYA